MAKSHFDIISDMEQPLLRMRDLAEAVFLMGASLSRGEAEAFQAVALSIKENAERLEQMRKAAWRPKVVTDAGAGSAA
jgi:hypothetical protein